MKIMYSTCLNILPTNRLGTMIVYIVNNMLWEEKTIYSVKNNTAVGIT